MYKSDNQILADVNTLLEGALASRGIVGWQAAQMAQPSMQDIRNNAVYFYKINSDRYGWQAHKNEFNAETKQMFAVESWIQRNYFQISFFLQRDPNEQTVLTEFLSSDVANNLMSYFNSLIGIDALANLGYDVIPISNMREISFKTSSDIFERIPSFDIVLINTQTYKTQIPYVTDYECDMIGI